jgi:hypothetical protein
VEHDFEANFFTLSQLLDPESRFEIDAACKRISFPADEMIYQQGDEAHSVYIVASGVVEAITHSPDGRQSRSVAYLKKGEFFGDLAVLTTRTRLGSVRTCEPTQVLQIEKLMFIQLLEKIPKFGAYFCRTLAKRLHKTATEAYLGIYSIDLGGNLQHFDLLTIFQAITSMRRSGELQLNNNDNELIGGFFFREGRVEFARFAHLEGMEAIWQGFFESAVEGAFTFQIMDKPTLPFSEEHKIDLDSTNLLLHGVERRDQYQTIPDSWRRMEGRLSRKTDALEWTDDGTAVPAARVWELIAKRPQPLASLWRRLNHCSLTYLQVVGELVTTGQAELLPDEPVEPKPEPSEDKSKPAFGSAENPT